MKDMVETELNKKLATSFLEVDDEPQNLAEAIISLWSVNKAGQLAKLKQVSFDYDGKYTPSKDNNMRL